MGLEIIQTTSHMICAHFTVLHIYDYSANSSEVSLYRLQGSELPSSVLSTDVLWGSGLEFGWATQGHSETCHKTTRALSWQYSSSYCPTKRLNLATV